MCGLYERSVTEYLFSLLLYVVGDITRNASRKKLAIDQMINKITRRRILYFDLRIHPRKTKSREDKNINITV